MMKHRVLPRLLGVLLIGIAFFMTADAHAQRKISGIWLLPFKVERVSGLTLNAWKTADVKSDTIQMNGVHFNFNPAAIAIAIPLIPLSLLGGYDYYFPHKTQMPFSRVNGLSMEFIDEKTRVNGISVAVAMNVNYQVSGLSLNGWLCKNHTVKGLTVAPFMNVNNVVEGMQLGLINRTKKLSGVQFGIWNVNQKRKLPFFNWCFDEEAG